MPERAFRIDMSSFDIPESRKVPHPAPLELNPQFETRAVAFQLVPAETGVESLEAEDGVVARHVVDPEIDPPPVSRAGFPSHSSGERRAEEEKAGSRPGDPGERRPDAALFAARGGGPQAGIGGVSS